MARKRVGPKLKFESSYILGEIINNYFDECDESEEPYTISGICLACGFTKNTFQVYGRKGPHVHIIEQARLIIQNQLEKALRGPGRAAGSIFTLKQFGWSDRQDINMNQRISGVDDVDDLKWTIEVVEPKKIRKDEIPDSEKVTPISRKAQAV